MPRRPDTPCAGGCGRLLWTGNTSLPSGERTCRACRKRLQEEREAILHPTVECDCGALFTARHSLHRHCSAACRVAADNRARRERARRTGRPDQ